MRPIHLFTRLSLTALAAASIAATPALAKDIIFAPGTGEAAYTEGVATPIPPALADYDAATETRGAAKNAQADMLAMADKLSDPDMQDGVAHMAERLGETMLRLPIGKFAAAIEKARPGTVRKRVRDDATLADLAGRNAQDIPAMIGKESRTAMKMMSGFAKVFAGMIPEFEKLGREMETAMADIKVKRR
jgi:hypothetical protein